MALEQPAHHRLGQPANVLPAAPASGQLGSLLSPQALAALAPTAASVPAALWQRVLAAPVAELLRRPGKGFRGRLTAIAYRLAGGQGDPPAALAAMLEIVHAGSMIIDDIEDGSTDRRGGPAVHQIHGVPIALNAGNWMYFAPFALLADLGLTAADELHLHRRMSRVLLDCHFGQALDLGSHPADLAPEQLADVVAAISVLKTGRLLALAAEAGAIVAGAGPAGARALGAFGEALGVGLQMLDDLGNLSGRAPADKRYEDLRCGRVTWPWAWAAAQLDERPWRALLAEQRCLAQDDDRAAPASWRWQPLAAKLRALVSAHGRSTAHWQLRKALTRLRGDLGDHRMIDELEREIARLEVSYG
jgi:geranylgeranyl pyrophosphate synthase